ncbi:hypothetical protein GCM10009745_36270 [Kribbella yunnanensis]|uniref:Secreted protein n=1 Tax=Kribbella yunnanensis TaxID=190194 RepID=A0ABN2HHU1_9ACTN
MQHTVHLCLVAFVVRAQAGQLEIGPIVAQGNDRGRHRQQAQDFLVTHAVESDTVRSRTQTDPLQPVENLVPEADARENLP